MKKIFNNRFVSMLIAVATVFASCNKEGFTDGDKFMLFYPDITDIGPSTNMTLKPTYHGAKPHDFNIYNVKFNGEVFQTECFSVEADNGRLSITDTDGLSVGIYSISISCKSGNQYFEFPDIIKVNMMRAVPEGIAVDPSELVLLLTQVNNVNSTESLPAAQIITEGNHVSIKNYRIANVTRDGVKMEDWTGFFKIDEATGLFEIVKNGTFVAGTYVFDFRLVTSAAGASSEEGLFANAFTVDIVSPPVSLAYEPEIKRVEEGTSFVSAAPSYVASVKDLTFVLKAVYPENVPVTVDAATGVVTLAAENGLKSGDQVQISIRVTNAYGTKDFDQVTRIDIVDYIQPISKFSYNDSTVWHATGYTIKPLEVDGDDVKFSFVDLPEALSELTIDEATGAISTVKGNKIEKGEYAVTVKVANDKGDMTADIAIKVIDNPYYFTKVSWGNNLGLTPVGDYASQHRVSITEDTVIPVDKAASDITEEGWKKVKFAMVDGSLPKIGRDAKIDEATGVITTVPSAYIATKGIAFKRAHVAMIEITVGEGTSGETTRKVPVFFDFNAPRVDSGNANAPVYTIEFNPFVFQCNPKKGGIFVSPTVRDESGNPISSEDYQKMSMTFLGVGTPYFWNLDGPVTHVDGAPDVPGGFLYQLWTQYYDDVKKGKTPAYTNVNPIYSYQTDNADKNEKWATARIGYLQNVQLDAISPQNHMRLYVEPEKWVDADGEYADGVFTAQVRVGYKDNTGAEIAAKDAKSPYQMYPFFIWFDTEF